VIGSWPRRRHPDDVIAVCLVRSISARDASCWLGFEQLPCAVRAAVVQGISSVSARTVVSGSTTIVVSTVVISALVMMTAIASAAAPRPGHDLAALTAGHNGGTDTRLADSPVGIVHLRSRSDVPGANHAG